MKMMMSLCFILLPTLALGQSFVDPKTNKLQMTVVGKVLMVKGEATRTPHSDSKAFIPLKEGTELFTGDDLVTMDKSIVKVKLTDDTVITLGPKSHFEIVLYNFETKTKRNAIFELKDGHLRSEVNQPADNNELTYKIGKVSMGIRGTQILAEIVKENKGEITKISLIEGQAFVDLTGLGHKNWKKIGLSLGKVLNTKLLTSESKEEDFLIALTPDQLKRLLAPEGPEGATFLKDLANGTTKKSLKESVSQAIGETNNKVKQEEPAEGAAPLDGVTLQKKKKVWSEILEEDQNAKDNP
ncbi:MAG: FecR family protein [Bacteriovoracaceae bacterium]